MNNTKNHIGLLIVLCLLAEVSFAQNVGIAEPVPNSKLDIVQTQTTGNTVEVTHGITTNASAAGFIKNSGTGYGLHVQNLSATSNISSGRFFQQGNGATAHGLLISMTGATVATTTGQYIEQLGLGIGSYTLMSNAASASTGSYISHAGSGDGLTIFQNGSGDGIYNQAATGYGIFNVLNSSTLGSINLMNAGGTASYNDLDIFNGTGVLVIGVNNTATPTAGGDVFGFYGIVRTATPTGPFVNGGVVLGAQSGRGHGVLITHSGLSGRNGEFNITNAANTDASLFAINGGQGAAVLGQNQNNVITGTVRVGNFAYTGTDVTDHMGVSGFSAPAVGWGIGVFGQGNFYGVYAQGNLAATGVKTFVIDHPLDPANKMLKHFSVESNEVLNLYRGVVQLDASGQATVQLPVYFDMINTNVSYQLTGIGTPQPPYVLSEVIGNTFEVAGAPNTKVSWTVYADRNDLYLQQNPQEGMDVVIKTGERLGKYISPELYGLPESSAMYPKPVAQQASQVNPDLINVNQTTSIRQEGLNTVETVVAPGVSLDPAEQ
jgi:hypothetical protein